MNNLAPMPDPVLVERYMRGACHIHAVAAVRAHGGHFAICYDDSNIYYESEDGDGDVSQVVHVWSVHEGPHGLIARDIFGDVPCSVAELQARIETFFPSMLCKFEFSEAWIDREGTLEELTELSGDKAHQPLAPICEQEIASAATLLSVTADPGRHLAMNLDALGRFHELACPCDPPAPA